MKPVLFHIGSLNVHSYGLFIALGTLLGITYLKKEGKKAFHLSPNIVTNLVIWIFVAAFIGGKLFLAFETKDFQFKDWYSGNGFVFYGSFIVAVPVMLWYFKKQALPVWPMLDIMAIVTCLVHAFGRIGCFMAGCCYGKPTHADWGVTFTDPQSSAEPLHTLLHPVQLYEAAYILLVALVLLLIKKYGLRFHGQLFLSYLLLYAIGRSVLENYRGNYEKGYFLGLISNAQFTAVVIALLSVVLYTWLRIKGQLLTVKNSHKNK